mmetsp:Transcript_8272/g.18264  ORF Transcript_8272/g.18264 Transcript_8272/m.18264 type:complete len:159 (+) Transcript_8272:55-531(+)
MPNSKQLKLFPLFGRPSQISSTDRGDNTNKDTTGHAHADSDSNSDSDDDNIPLSSLLWNESKKPRESPSRKRSTKDPNTKEEPPKRIGNSKRSEGEKKRRASAVRTRTAESGGRPRANQNRRNGGQNRPFLPRGASRRPEHLERRQFRRLSGIRRSRV